MPPALPYGEPLRPQFHFSARENWLNDPNGCVFYAGEYHLFFQHNPTGIDWGNMTWGHAVSRDLVHWQQLPHALLPYDGGTIYSGTAVVDADNRSGFGVGGAGPLVAAFTHAREPYGQALAYSRDHGRTWQLYAAGKHVVPNQGLDLGERDPKIFWYAPGQHWVMVLWVQRGQARFFTSADLKTWTHASDFTGAGFYECPDLVELPVADGSGATRWVLYDAAFSYWVGTFDGRTFTPESGPHVGDHGANFYAAQTFSNTGTRVVQIGWMRGGQYPAMPFNQQMSFPCELTLRQTPAGLRLYRQPVAELATLYRDRQTLSAIDLPAGGERVIGPPGDLWDIHVAAALRPGAELVVRVAGQEIVVGASTVRALGRSAPLATQDGQVDLRVLVDRTSMEVFADGGAVVLSSCYLPPAAPTAPSVQAAHGGVQLLTLTANALASAWPPAP